VSRTPGACIQNSNTNPHFSFLLCNISFF
jgi:hypothetical protein